MNDNIIISAISKIYFIIVSFLSFIFLLLSVVFILLQNGIYIENINIPNLQIKKLYIKWNEKLDISLDELKITKKEETSNNTFDYKQIKKIFKELVLFDTWFENVVIQKIVFNDISASFHYKYGESGFFNALSPNFSLKSLLYFESNLFNIEIIEFKDIQREIIVDGNIILNLYTKDIEIITALNVDINNDVKLKVFIDANKEKLLYRVNSLSSITNIKHTIKLFNLGEDINYWALDAIDMSSLSINSIYGWLEYKNLQEFYKNLYISATVHDLKYTYNKQLDSIDSKNTELEFKNGILYIYPKKAYTAGFFLDKSWIKLDLTKEEELVTIQLLFKGMLNDNLLSITKAYGVKLPFYQHKGLIDTNLKLEINLQTMDLQAKGDFFTKNANFDYLGLNLNIFDAYISLENGVVTIKNMLAKYDDEVSVITKVDVNFDTSNSLGTIDFTVKDISFKDVDLSLYNQKKPLRITYNILKDGDIIDVDASVWKFSSKLINVDSLHIDFDSNKLSMDIPKTLVNMPKVASSYVWGKVLLQPIRAHLNIDLFQFTTHGLTLAQPHAKLQLTYDKKFTLSSNKKVKFNFDDLEYVIANTKLDILNNTLDLKYSYLSLKDRIETKLNGLYSFEDEKGTLNLNYLKIKNEKLGEIFYNSKNTKLSIDSKRDDLLIRSNEFDIDFIISDSKWKLNLNSLSKLTKKSKILNDYNVTNGNFTLYKNKNDSFLSFYGDVKYPYEILVLDNKPVQNYTIRGKYKDSISLNINNSIDVAMNKNITIDAQNIGINLNAVLAFFNERKSTSDGSQKSNFIINFLNSHLYIDESRRIISESMSLQYFNSVITAQLLHNNGSANLELIDNDFHIYGKNFNDKFMENLFALSKFKNGSLAFSMNGTTSEYDGVFHVKDTTIVEYKVLNNVLAFVNTIPSLITFSLPGYSRKGLDVSDGYMIFHSKDDEFDISDIYVKSKELTILGRGRASFKRNDINLRLNLKTDLGSAISQIPIVGYILLGDDTVATTLSITGALDDPKVESLIAEDIIVAPLNIIKRTFLLPYHLITSD